MSMQRTAGRYPSSARGGERGPVANGEDGHRSGDADGSGPGLWFGLLGGGVAWAVQFIAGYLISEGVCVGASGGGAVVGTGVAVAVGLSLAALAVAVAAALAGRRVWRREGDEPAGGKGFAGLAGCLLSAGFAFVIAVQSLPLFIGGGCS